MTHDEAIMILKNEQPHCGKRALFPEEKKYEAYDVAIKALEQQACEDAVSREAVLDIFADNADATRPYSKTWEEVKALPSVNPQHTDVEIQKMQDLEQAEIEKAYELRKEEEPKTGHWEKMVEVYDLLQNRMLVPYGYDDAKFGNTPVYVCDCGCESNKNSRFCPDCGCRMVDKQESEG